MFRIDRFIFLVSVFALGANAVFWNDLRVTFSLRFPFLGFTPFPRTVDDAREMNFVQDSFSCFNNGEFYGFRYIDPEDDYLGVLYDVQGTLAGIQVRIPESVLLVNSTYRYDRVPLFQPTWKNGVKHYMLTAYFVRAETICAYGRPKVSLLNEGTGTGLYFQNGNIYRMLTLPRDRKTAIAHGWSDNACVPGMGKHNYYLGDRWGDNNCQTIPMQPFFGIYNQQDQLHGFGFTTERAIPHNRFEIQTKGNIRAAQPEAAECVVNKVDTSGISTLHVYFVTDPWRIPCGEGSPSLMDLIKAINEQEHDDKVKGQCTETPTKRILKFRGPGSHGPTSGPGNSGPGTGEEPPTTTSTSNTFVIPASLMQTILKMNDKLEDSSRQSVADDLHPGETFEDVDITHAMVKNMLDDNLRDVPIPYYDTADAIRLANADRNVTTVITPTGHTEIHTYVIRG